MMALNRIMSLDAPRNSPDETGVGADRRGEKASAGPGDIVIHPKIK